MSDPPRRPSQTRVPVAIPPRTTTGTLLAVGAHTDGVDEAERAIAPWLSAAITPEGRRVVRETLLRMAQRLYHEGEDHRQAVLHEHADAVRRAYWSSAREAELMANDPNARPAVDAVALEAARSERLHLPERDVRAILRLFGLSTRD